MAVNSRVMWTKSHALPVPTGRLSGQAVLSGATLLNLHGVLLTSEGAHATGGVGNIDGEATVALDGSFVLNVTTTTVIAKGGPVYIIPATHVLTPVATSNQLFGYAMEAKGAAAADIEVMIACQV